MNERKIRNWKHELIFIAFLILIFLFGAMISSSQASSIGVFKQEKQINIISQTGELDTNLTYSFTEVNNTYWIAKFCIKPTSTIVFSPVNYPLVSLTTGITFEQVSPIKFNSASKCGQFYIIFPEGFKPDLRAKFGTNSTLIATSTTTPFMSYQRAICRDANNEIHVAYLYNTTWIEYAKSTDNGVTWTNATLNTSTNVKNTPHITCSGGTVLIAYTESTANAISLLKSTDNGATWTYQQLRAGIARPYTVGNGGGVNIELIGTNAYVVYQKMNLAYDNIEFFKSTDTATTWGADVNVWVGSYIGGKFGCTETYVLYTSTVNGTGGSADNIFISVIYVFSGQGCGDGQVNIMKNSSNSGTTWSSSYTLSSYLVNPSMTAWGNAVYYTTETASPDYDVNAYNQTTTYNYTTFTGTQIDHDTNATYYNISQYSSVGINSTKGIIIYSQKEYRGGVGTYYYQLMSANFSGGWGTPYALTATSYDNKYPNMKTYDSGGCQEYVYMNGSASPYSVSYGSIGACTAPTAPPSFNGFFNVSWSLPQNNTWNTSQTIVHSYTPLWYDTTMANCSVWSNVSGTFILKASNSTPLTNNTINTISFNYATDSNQIWSYINCTNSSGTNNYTSNYTIKIDTIAPSTPTLTLNLVGATWANLSIGSCTDAGSGVLKKLLYRDNTNIANFTTETSYNDTPLLNMQTYSYKLSCLDNAGWYGSNSTKLDVTTSATCLNITASGTYLMVNDLVNPIGLITAFDGSVCILISASNVIFDCQNHVIEGIRTSITYGIFVDNQSNTVKNCVISNWTTGIAVYPPVSANSNKFYNNTSNNNTYDGFDIQSSYNDIWNNTAFNNSNVGIEIHSDPATEPMNEVVVNNTVSNSVLGLVLYALQYDNVGNSTIANNTISNNLWYGTELMYSNNISVYNNIISGNDIVGVYIYLSGNNTLYNNLFNNTDNIGLVLLFNHLNYMNTTQQSGTRIYSSGTQIGGNYYTNSTGNGYSDTCQDCNGDGFCDVPLDLCGGTYGVNNTDYLPLSNKYGNFCKAHLGEGDPLYCSIKGLLSSAQDTQMFCMPKSNITGQPLLGVDVVCGAYNSSDFSEIQPASSATEQGNGLYNWTFLSSFQEEGESYIINCSSDIEGTINWFAGVVSILPNYTTSCPSVINQTVNVTENGTNTTINNTFITNLSPEIQKELSKGIAKYLLSYEEAYNSYVHPVVFGLTMPYPIWFIIIIGIFFIICSALGVWFGFQVQKKMGWRKP